MVVRSQIQETYLHRKENQHKIKKFLAPPTKIGCALKLDIVQRYSYQLHQAIRKKNYE